MHDAFGAAGVSPGFTPRPSLSVVAFRSESTASLSTLRSAHPCIEEIGKCFWSTIFWNGSVRTSLLQRASIVAWATAGRALNALAETVLEHGLKVRAIVGTRGNLTGPEALEKLDGIGELRLVVDEWRMFHPNVYIFRRERKPVVWIGRANFTRGGFETNEEDGGRETRTCSEFTKLTRGWWYGYSQIPSRFSIHGSTPWQRFPSDGSQSRSLHNVALTRP